MIAQMTPDQAASNWDIYARGIERSLPPVSKGADIRMNNILEGITSGAMQLWGCYDDNEEPSVICLTTIVVDRGTYIRSLLIYAVVRIAKSRTNFFKEGIDVLKAFARNADCQIVAAYTEQDMIVEAAMELGANTDWTYITFKV